MTSQAARLAFPVLLPSSSFLRTFDSEKDGLCTLDSELEHSLSGGHTSVVRFICPGELLLLPGLCFTGDFVAWGGEGGGGPAFCSLLIHDSFTICGA